MAAMLILLGHHSYEGIKTYRDVDRARDHLENQVDMLDQEIVELKEEHDRLLTDMSYYEQLGREAFGMIKPNETVYIVPLD